MLQKPNISTGLSNEPLGSYADLTFTQEAEPLFIPPFHFFFFQAKCAVGLVYELINEVKQAARLAKSSGNQQIAVSLKEFAQMLSENVQVLNIHPECTLQEAANFPDSSAPAKAAQVGTHMTKITRSFFQFQIGLGSSQRVIRVTLITEVLPYLPPPPHLA